MGVAWGRLERFGPPGPVWGRPGARRARGRRVIYGCAWVACGAALGSLWGRLGPLGVAWGRLGPVGLPGPAWGRWKGQRLPVRACNFLGPEHGSEQT